MIDPQQLAKWQKTLDNKIPILGPMQRRSAVRQMVQQTAEAQVIPLLLAAMVGSDAKAAGDARTALESLPGGESQDAVCDLAINEPEGTAAKLCIARQFRHREHERNCLMLFVTGQLDAYFQEDDDFHSLRAQYDRADAKVRGRVMDVVRRGDRRCQPFVTRPRKKLRECTEVEIKLALSSCLRHKDWARLFQASMELPMKFSFPALQRLADMGWQPDTPEKQALLKAISADVKGQSIVPASSQPVATSSVFDQWLAQGREGELAGVGEAELLTRLKQADPPDGVAIVGALAAKAKPGSPAAKAVAENEHWMVRLAGHLCGLVTPDLTQGQQNDDPNYWVNMLATAEGVLEFWPTEATPADLEKLNHAPAEAFSGKLGAVRKVLRTLLAHQVTAITVSRMEVQADGAAAEFVVASA